MRLEPALPKPPPQPMTEEELVRAQADWQRKRAAHEAHMRELAARDEARREQARLERIAGNVHLRAAEEKRERKRRARLQKDRT